MIDPTSYLSHASSLRDFVEEASLQPLPGPEDDALVAAAAAGDDEALDNLVRRHLRLVLDEVIVSRGEGVSSERLVRAGLRGLLASAAEYDLGRHGPFSHHARLAIRREIHAALLGA
ncbi:MAG: hypothetical protein PVJ02_04650 [Gemmatimonadota bacterium]|jgi:DNA-directed RNA polymerase sigma subunit (sigma70/sigma32)